MAPDGPGSCIVVLVALACAAQAVQSGQPSNVDQWSRGDIVELVSLLVGIPAGLVAVVMLAMYVRRFRLRKHVTGDLNRAEANILGNTNGLQGTGLIDEMSERPGIESPAVEYPRPAFLTAPCKGAQSQPSRLQRWRAREREVAETSIGSSSRRTQIHDREIESRNDDPVGIFQDEVDAQIEQERKKWAEELELGQASRSV